MSEFSMIDPEAVFDELVRRDAAFAEADAVYAEIEHRHWQLIAADWGDHPDAGDEVKAQAARADAVARTRRARADGIRARLADKPSAVDVRDMRPSVALRLVFLERSQVMLDEMAEHTDLYAITDIEEGVPQDPQVPPRPNAEQLHYDAARGAANVQAHQEWLTAHPGGPSLSDSPSDAAQMPAVAAARKFFGIDTPASSESGGEASNSDG